MPYIIYRDANDLDEWTTYRYSSKDEVIASLVYWLRSSHGEQVRIIYPDGDEWA